jgi:two-component system, cell cycle response regulator
VIRLRNETALIVTALLAGVGLIGYVLGMLIVRPLNRLIQAAGAVAGGNLDVDLAVTTGGEVGYLTEVFNNMVVRLRQGRQALDAINETLRTKNEELERLSVTDGLTKLYNRRLLMQRLDEEIVRCRRHKRAFSVLMADVDHFKRYNDAYGHLAGDEVLTRVAAILRETTREVDCAARYGGEEFVVVLAETPLQGAVGVSARVQERLAAELFEGDKITLSVGVCEFPAHGDTAQALIASADAAMYEAKAEGRDRVIAAPKKPGKEAKKPA